MLATRPEAEVAPARSRRDLADPIRWYLASRLLVLAVAAVAVAVRPELSGSRLVSAWDAQWYLDILRHGYPSVVPEVAGHATRSTLAFFPLFPMVTGAVAQLFHLPNTVAAIGLSLTFGATATLVFHRLAARLTNDRAALRATVLFCLFPGSAVFSIGYSESLMITLAGACLLALLDRRWWLAGLTAALATATRPNAAGLVLACAVASAAAILRDRDWRSLIAPVLAPAGMLAFFAFLGWRTGEAGVWFRIQREAWNQEFDFGINTAKTIWNFIIDPLGQPEQIVVMVLLGFTLCATAVFLSKRWPLPVTVYTLSVVALAVCSTIDIVRPRGILTAFPLFIGLAALPSRREYTVLAGLFAAGLGLLVFFPFWGSP